MKRNRHFLQSTKAETNWLWVVLIIAVIAVATGAVKIGTTGVNFNLGGQGPGATATPPPAAGGYTRPIQFHISDAFSGADSEASIYVYDASTRNQIGSTLQSDSSGLARTGKSFQAGDQVIVKLINGSSKYETTVSVPQILQGDTYANIEIPFFTIGTYTSDSLRVSGSSINDAGSYNHTLTGNSPTFVYELTNTGADNTGLKESQNSITGQSWRVAVVVSFSGTGYETISASGFDQQFSIGTTNYGVLYLNADQLSKWKVGSNYMPGFTGDQAVSFSLDTSAYTGTGVTMQITAYAYSDPAYAATHGGNFGGDKVQLAEQTVTLTT